MAAGFAIIFNIKGYRKIATLWISPEGNWNSLNNQIRVHDGEPPLANFTYVTGEWYGYMEEDSIPKKVFLKWINAAKEMVKNQ